GRDADRLGTVEIFDLHPHALGCDREDMVAEELRDLLGLLIGNQSHGDLRAAPRGQNGLRPLRLIAAVDAVDVAGGTGPGALTDRVAFFAPGLGDSELFAVRLLVEGQLRELLALPG